MFWLHPDRRNYGPHFLQPIHSFHQGVIDWVLLTIFTFPDFYLHRVYDDGDYYHLLSPHSLRFCIFVPTYPEILGLFRSRIMCQYQHVWRYYVYRKRSDRRHPSTSTAAHHTGPSKFIITTEDNLGFDTHGWIFVSPDHNRRHGEPALTSSSVCIASIIRLRFIISWTKEPELYMDVTRSMVTTISWAYVRKPSLMEEC